jgi:hypothetical protein
MRWGSSGVIMLTSRAAEYCRRLIGCASGSPRRPLGGVPDLDGDGPCTPWFPVETTILTADLAGGPSVYRPDSAESTVLTTRGLLVLSIDSRPGRGPHPARGCAGAAERGSRWLPLWGATPTTALAQQRFDVMDALESTVGTGRPVGRRCDVRPGGRIRHGRRTTPATGRRSGVHQPWVGPLPEAAGCRWDAGSPPGRTRWRGGDGVIAGGRRRRTRGRRREARMPLGDRCVLVQRWPEKKRGPSISLPRDVIPEWRISK